MVKEEVSCENSGKDIEVGLGGRGYSRRRRRRRRRRKRIDAGEVERVIRKKNKKK